MRTIPIAREVGNRANNTTLASCSMDIWCLMVHNKTTGMLITLHKTKLLEEIANQLSMGGRESNGEQ